MGPPKISQAIVEAIGYILPIQEKSVAEVTTHLFHQIWRNQSSAQLLTSIYSIRRYHKHNQGRKVITDITQLQMPQAIIATCLQHILTCTTMAQMLAE